MACTLLECDVIAKLYQVADIVGPMTFGALSFLVAVITLFRELKQDKIIVTRGHFRLLRIAIFLLAGESILWALISFTKFFTLPAVLLYSPIWEIIMLSMLSGVILIAALLARFVQSVGELVARDSEY